MMASLAVFESTTRKTTTRNPHKTRKRASKACLCCRARKVRCDVSQRGRPCMNCHLDNETCVVTGRASRLRKAERDGSPGARQMSHPPYESDILIDDSVDVGVNGENPLHIELMEVVNNSQTAEDVHMLHTSGQGGVPGEMSNDSQSYIQLNEHPDSLFSQTPHTTQAFDNASSVPMQGFAPLGNSEMPFWLGEQPVAANADITYSYYPFLAINNLHSVIPQDVNFLESQGCLRVPTRAILDEFVQQYFLHVHPLLPFLHEGDFWHLYGRQDNGGGGGGEKMSLLVFQAMMFSCCNFVSKASIKALGFPNIRTARATLYRRAKLLFDFDTESSLVCLAQAALLLTYWSPNWSLATKKPNTAWLGVAIQNAKSAEAHIHSAMPVRSREAEPAEYRRQNTLRRLWWCCVLRDRLIALGMRRSIQISRAHFDVDANVGLGFDDLADEIPLSRVYDPPTKRRLIEVFIQLGELCSVLTDLLTLVFPLDDVPGWGRHNSVEGAEKIRKCKTALRRWYKTATLRFPMFSGSGKSSSKPNRGEQQHSRHDSVILYTNLMYMFYHSARAALCHHEVLQTAMASASPNINNSPRGFPNIYESRHELQDAACGVTDCLSELIQRRIARWLPISAIPCTAMPLALHIIDVKLSSRNKLLGIGNSSAMATTPDEKRRATLKQQRLNVLIEAMKTYQPQYDGVDYISETIRHIVNLAQIDTPDNDNTIIGGSNKASLPHNTTTATTLVPQYDLSKEDGGIIISDWTDILASNPGSYLRLAMTMDISISKGRLARETDFPVRLRGLFTHGLGLSPIRMLPPPATTLPPPSASPSSFSFTTPVIPPQNNTVPTNNNTTANIQSGSVRSISPSSSLSSPTDSGSASLDAGNSVDNWRDDPPSRTQHTTTSDVSSLLSTLGPSPSTDIDVDTMVRDDDDDVAIHHHLFAAAADHDHVAEEADCWIEQHVWDDDDAETADALLGALVADTDDVGGIISAA